MNQRPIDGAVPLPVPDPEIAQAYLDEVSAVRSRREEGIDRRGAAWFGLMDAVILSVYITVIAIGMGEASASSSFIVFAGVYLVWVQFANQRREGYGIIGYGLSSPWLVATVLCAVLIIVLAAAFFSGVIGVEIPLIVRLVPGVLTLLILGSAALRSILGSSPVAGEPATRVRLTLGARVATIVTGAVLALGIWVLSVGDELLRPLFGMLLMLGYLGWWTAVRVTERMPALGALWAWPQWTAFAASGGTIAAILLLQALGETSLLDFGPVAAAVAFGLSVISAFLDGRDG